MCILLETALEMKFPPAFPEFIDVVKGNPTKISDRTKHILGWYLPGILSNKLQVMNVNEQF